MCISLGANHHSFNRTIPNINITIQSWPASLGGINCSATSLVSKDQLVQEDMALPLISVALKFCIVCAFNGVLLMVLSVESCDSFFLRAAVPSRSGLTQLQSMLYTGKGPSRPPQPPNPDDGQKDDKDTVADTPDILKIDLTRDVEQISEEDCVPQEDVFGGSAGPLPSVSSKINMKEEKLKEGLAELWIVGAGTMGSILAKKMAAQITASGKAGENMMVIAETASNKRHKEFLDIEGEVVLPKIRSEREEDDERMARNVIVCLPPSAATGRQGSYINELSEAFRLWAGPKGVRFVLRFGVVQEQTPLTPP